MNMLISGNKRRRIPDYYSAPQKLSPGFIELINWLLNSDYPLSQWLQSLSVVRGALLQYSYLHYECEFGQHWYYNLTPCNVKIKHIPVSYPCNVPTEEIFAQQVRYSFSFPQTEFSVRWRDEGNLCKCVYFPFLCLFQSQNGGSKAERLLGSI